MALALGGVMVAGAAGAQTTTDCYSIGGTLHCQSSAPPGTSSGVNVDFGLLRPAPDYAGDYARAYQAGQAMAAARAAQRAQQEATREAEQAREDDLQRQAAAWRADQDRQARALGAGALIRDGHCDQARDQALSAGDLDLAAHVAALCPAPATSK